MKKITFALMMLVLVVTSLEARGGRGGGGGGRGGGGRSYQGGRTMNRTPSMSRATSRPTANRSNINRSAVNRPTSGNRDLRTADRRPSAQNHQDLRNQVNRYNQNRPAANINRQDLSARNQSFSNNRVSQLSQNRQLSNRASDGLRNRWPDSNRWFDRNFFDRHDLDVGYRGDLWRPAAWGALATWGAWNWATPYYYDYGGYSYPVTTSEYSTYTAPAAQAAPIAQTEPSTGSDWLPLGVFAVASNAAQAVNSNRFIQLAVNRNGDIDGVYYNASTDTAQDLAGTVDPKTQRASWSLTNKLDSPIASTGIYNLTEDQTPINVHFSDGTDQTWTLVRIQQ